MRQWAYCTNEECSHHKGGVYVDKLEKMENSPCFKCFCGSLIHIRDVKQCNCPECRAL